MNVTSTHTSTTAVSCSVATSSSKSLSNDNDKPNQLKRLFFPKCDYGHMRFMECASSLALSRSAEMLYLNLRESVFQLFLACPQTP